MKRNRTTFRQGRDEHGQVLILAVVALILVIIATLLLFDIQTVIRGKIKGQNGVDAAALTGAEWQKHSLNLIGELNLVRATGVLISDPFFANGILKDPNSNAAEFFADIPLPTPQEEFTLFPEKEEFYNEDGSLNVEKLAREVLRVEKEKRYLDSLDDLVSQLQTRIAFVGPLLGFGAAQQAAKNNGLQYDSKASEEFIDYLNNYVGNEGVYERITPVFVRDYAWRMPYIFMLESILDYSTIHNDFTGETDSIAYGIAASPYIEYALTPTLVANPPTLISSYLGKEETYDYIHARDWCALDELLQEDFSGSWWGDFECDFEEHFTGQSEILPLHIAFSETSSTYDKANDAGALARYAKGGNRLFSDTFNGENPYEYDVSDDVVTREEHEDRKHTYYTLTNISITIDSDRFEELYNDRDADRRYDLLPRLSWATFDETWTSFDDEFMRAPFKPGMDYHGAAAYFETSQDTVTISGSMGRPRRGFRAADVGQVFASSNTHGEAQRVSNTLNQLNANSINKIETDAEAKPIGRIRTENGQYLRPFEAGRMVLPIFTETALTRIEEQYYSKPSISWIRYLTEFIPLLSGSSSIQDAWERATEIYPNHLGDYAYYVSALAMLDNPAFRQAGINWLNATAVWTKDAKGNRIPLYTNRQVKCSSGGSGGGSFRSGPPKLH